MSTNLIEHECLMRISQRIACPERGYPDCEARFASIRAWEVFYGANWELFLKYERVTSCQP